MIERHWKGTTKTEDADRYVEHLTSETFPKLSAIKGFIRASILKKSTDTGIEFLIITVWESLDAIKEFAGETADNAVVPLIIQEMMIEYDKKVLHYEVAVAYIPDK